MPSLVVSSSSFLDFFSERGIHTHTECVFLVSPLGRCGGKKRRFTLTARGFCRRVTNEVSRAATSGWSRFLPLVWLAAKPSSGGDPRRCCPWQASGQVAQDEWSRRRRVKRFHTGSDSDKNKKIKGRSVNIHKCCEHKKRWTGEQVGSRWKFFYFDKRIE